MIALTLAEVAEVVGGTLHDADQAAVVGAPGFIDTRTPEPGGLFVALVGEHADGHDHAAAAAGAGAVAVLGTRPTGVPTVVVPDAQRALQDLATAVLARRRADGGPLTVVAITGSQGKTSAKDLLAQVLGDHAPTVATAGSFNNELGLPLTVLRLTDETRYLVLEMGARGIGHLTELCAVAPPDVSLVLNVGKAHLGEFGSQANIAQAKGELVAALDAATGTAVLNGDDPLVTVMDQRTPGVATTRFGQGEAADVRLLDLALDDVGRPGFDLLADGSREHVQLQLLGAHQATNAAAAAAVGLAAGLDLAEVARSLRGVERLSRWRMELGERPDGLVVVNDAYNANPDSMRSALETLAGIGERSGRRTVAVLGEMRELGPDSEAEHRDVGALAARLGVDAVVVVGEGASGIADALAEAGHPATHHVPGVAEASAWLRENVGGPDVVLVKASRSGRLEQVAQTLLEDHDAPTDGARREELER